MSIFNEGCTLYVQYNVKKSLSGRSTGTKKELLSKIIYFEYIANATYSLSQLHQESSRQPNR